MKKFIRKFLLFSITPFIGVLFFIIIYVVNDPFSVVYNYKNYSGRGSCSLDYISGNTFLNNYPEYGYDSFIFGSSRALAFRPDHWARYLDEKASPLVFSASAETFFGIYTKIKYLDKHNIKINNAIVLFDVDLSFLNKEIFSPPFYRHPQIFDYPWYVFHLNYLKSYFSEDFFLPYLNYRYLKIGDTKAMNDMLHNGMEHDANRNIVILRGLDERIATDTSYYDNNMEFAHRYDKPEVAQISDSIKQKLEEIHSIFQKHHTKYRIILDPVYSQAQYTSSDVDALRNIFGEKNVYNFTGKNKFTESKSNYYEHSHFRPFVGDSIMNIIYRDK